MPDKPSYIHRFTEILTEARCSKPIPFFRRKDVEALFGLKKRQALNLMHSIGAVRVSRELALVQRELVEWLEERVSDPSTRIERQRRERVIGRIVDLKAETAARAVRIVLPDRAPSVDLPDGVSLLPGLLTISFNNEQELVERLFLLARVFATQPQLLDNLRLPR